MMKYRTGRLARFTRYLDPMTSIRGRLISGFGVLMMLLAVAGAVGWSSMGQLTQAITGTLDEVQTVSRLSSQLSTAVSQTVQAGARYVDTRDARDLARFRDQGWQAHQLQRQLNALGHQSADQVTTVAAVDARLSEMEVRYARAHRLAELGRMDAARREAAAAQDEVDPLLSTIKKLGELNAQNVAQAAEKLSLTSKHRAVTLLTLIGIALLFAMLVVSMTVRGVGRPLDTLVAHARRLSEGDLTTRTDARLPGEFQILAEAMNQTGTSLSRVVAVAARTAADVASSAHQLASVSEQISLSASQMAGAMVEVSAGAEQQVAQLRTIDDSLQEIREGATAVLDRASEVDALAHEIERSADEKRSEIERAVGMLGDVRVGVEQAAKEVVALDETVRDINRFVRVVSEIAEQTNLLALNAAIEAARAGEHGRGFAVVADEVRKLAEQSAQAARDIVQMTQMVTTRVATSSRVMSKSAQRVGEIERLSRELDGALRTIRDAADRALGAATSVKTASEANVTAAERAASGIGDIARTAESHAAAAGEVNAATQEQSAACEEMTSASSSLLDGSTRLQTLVGGLRTNAA